MVIELSDFYTPTEILHRDSQIQELKHLFETFKKFGSASNLAIFGCTGSGKTTIIKKVIEEEDGSIYLNGRNTPTAYKTIKSIFNLKCQTHEESLRLTIERLKKEPKILIIDEIDKIENYISLFDDLNHIYRETMIPIIVITLKHNIISQIAVDARKTLYFNKIIFPAYNSMELRDILISRLKQIQMPIPEISEGTINYISAIAGRQGSARALITILSNCLHENNFDHDFIDSVYKQMLQEECFEFVYEISDTEKEFLKYLIESCDADKETNAEVLEKRIGLSSARVSQLLNHFEKYNLIETYHKNLGRVGGRKRMIKFKSAEIYQETKKRIFGL